MAVLSCKMCGGELEIEEGSLIAKCRYCGTKQTVPKLDSEKKTTLFARANRLRFNSEFDKAAGVYESIVAEYPEEAEAYWGLVLCKYGIEYVDDPATAKKIPTCHRTSFVSVMEDTDYEQTLENADQATRAVYREEAKAIEALRQSIVEVSAKEEPYDIFICYKETDTEGNRTIDSVIAQDVYTALTEKGYRVFFSRISLEDKLGKEYEPYIFAALNSAKIMLAFGTDYEYYNAVWVKNEWSRFIKLMATDRTKTLIPCYKGIDAYDMPKEFIKLQSQDMGKVGAIQDLLRGIDKILPKNKPEVKTVEKVVEKVVVKGAEGGADTGSLLERAEMFLEDGDFTSANTYAEKVLDIDPKCAEAYLVKLCCDLRVKSHTELGKQTKSFAANPNYKKILRFSDDSLKEEINGYLAQVEERVAAIKKKNAEEAKIKEQARQKKIEELAKIRKRNELCRKLIACDNEYVLGVTADGRVLASGKDFIGRCNMTGMFGVISATTGYTCSYILKDNGTVLQVGGNDKVNLSAFTDIKEIDSGFALAGLKNDGTVISTSPVYTIAARKIEGWEDITTISVGDKFTLGLKSDGTVLCSNGYMSDKIVNWKDIVAISAGNIYNSAGVKSDGTVVVTDKNIDVSSLKDIVSVGVLYNCVVALKADGMVQVVGKKDDLNQTAFDAATWTDIVAIKVSGHRVIGVKSDGRVVVTKGDKDANVSSWKLFGSADTVEWEIESSKKSRAEAIAKLINEKKALQNELANLKGIFAGKRRKEIEARLAEIDNQLSKL